VAREFVPAVELVWAWHGPLGQATLLEVLCTPEESELEAALHADPEHDELAQVTDAVEVEVEDGPGALAWPGAGIPVPEVDCELLVAWQPPSLTWQPPLPVEVLGRPLW